MAHSLKERLHNLYWERKFDITTNGVLDVNFPDANHYATMCYSTIHRVLDHLSLTPSDVFLDLGSGKGRVLCCAAHRQVKKVIGVEISKELCRIAEVNLARMRYRVSAVEVMNRNAQEFDFHGATAMFLFNPFGPSTVEAVLDQIERSRNSHPMRIAYVNPLYDSILAQRKWLRPTTRWDAQRIKIEHSVTFYISSP
jgi:16S rRNA G966 N2-methylase RsmD